ncbi:tRNA (adenosine(37)-N6)-dimethylallyltransferase MiaA [Mycoplasmoides pirum]|uniref:tRNA (adenosine(37)-N6)-dimethylallyltransferase MiaA n=1 Tax=Mycoplasmoides pirum TaxID=2122 RepID=UPI000698FEFF|nr:tRNA (adenosine(37)-N6)-dimethylallyltransferase MiaA [Mycoplasmoides pirum]
MKQKIIAIVGPTGSKKSFLAIEIAKYLNLKAEIISADAFQVYKEISVGINKPNVAELNKVNHHFINNISVNDSWNIKIFKDQAEKIIDSLLNKKFIPIICGGSHLYIDAITKNYNLSNSPMRDRNLYKNWSNEQIFEKFFLIDPTEAKKISKYNRKRLIRALEIYETTGFKKNELIQNQILKYDVLYIYCNLNNKNLLMELLNKRTEKMFNNGWTDEIKFLIDNQPNFINSQASKAIGYSYLIDCILNKKEIELDELKKLIRQLAKKQIKWCNNHYINKTIHFDYLENNINSIFKQVSEFFNI